MSSRLTFHQHHNTLWSFQFADHLLKTVSTNDFCAFCLILKEGLDFVRGTVVGTYNEAMVIHVKNEVLAHYGQTNQGNVSNSKIEKKLISFRKVFNSTVIIRLT